MNRCLGPFSSALGWTPAELTRVERTLGQDAGGLTEREYWFLVEQHLQRYFEGA